MKIKLFTCFIAVLFAVGFAGSALAALDIIGDELVTGYDIASTNVLYFDAPAPADDSVKLTLTMDTGEKLPGMILLEVDVDNKSQTGGSIGLAGVFGTCASGGATKIKEIAGVDVLVLILLRDQTADSGTAWCSSCLGGGGQCFNRGAKCDGVCGGTDCYKAGTSCAPDSGPTCYVATDPCSEPRPTCDQCYELSTVCTSSNPCDTGRLIGEWYADTSATGMGGGAPAAWGRIDMPLPVPADDTSGTDYYALPWGRIIEKVHARATLGADPAKVFALADGQNPANFRYQVSTWYDPDDTTPPANDFFDETAGNCAEITDIVPNAGYATIDTTKVCTTGCQGDFDIDADVDGTDATKFKGDFFRKNCLNTDIRSR